MQAHGERDGLATVDSAAPGARATRDSRSAGQGEWVPGWGHPLRPAFCLGIFLPGTSDIFPHSPANFMLA